MMKRKRFGNMETTESAWSADVLVLLAVVVVGGLTVLPRMVAITAIMTLGVVALAFVALSARHHRRAAVAPDDEWEAADGDEA